MTAKEYIEHGYRMSLQVSQTEIDRAERDVCVAYLCHIYPIPHDEDYLANVDAYAANIMARMSSEPWEGLDGVQSRACACLAFLLVCQRSALGTRSGAKVPNITSAAGLSSDAMLQQAARDAAMYLEQMKEAYRISSSADTDSLKLYEDNLAGMQDICGIYWRTNYYQG